jgi:hypothetical protein
MALAAVLGLAAGSAAWGQAAAPQAQAGKPSAAVREACASDVRALCPSAQPGSGEIRECLRQNAAKLSPPCRQALRAAHAAHKEGAATPGTP